MGICEEVVRILIADDGMAFGLRLCGEAVAFAAKGQTERKTRLVFYDLLFRRITFIGFDFGENKTKSLYRHPVLPSAVVAAIE